MRFQLLGPLCISDGEHAVVLQPSKPTNLLATLLLRSGTIVSADYLLHTVWDTEPPATAKAALQSCVLRLRRIFIKHGIADDTIESVASGYRMRVSGDTLDLADFRNLMAAADRAADYEDECQILRQALSLWHGPVLANVTSQVLHRDEVPRLSNERLRALERLCDLELSLGRCHHVLADLWDATRSHPERERFAEQLIEALYRTGRQTEALTEFDRVKRRLKEEFGIDPGAPLQRLQMSVLRGADLGSPPTGPVQSIAVSPRMPATPPIASLSASSGLRVSQSVSGRLPPAASSTAGGPPTHSFAFPVVLGPVPCFAGRSDHLKALKQQLAAANPGTSSLVVVSGAPGVGKTALALQAAHHSQGAFPAGSAAVSMSRSDGSPLSLSEIRAQIPAPSKSGRRLLILDDAVSAEQTRPLLLPPSDGVTVVTSRRRLSGLAATHGGTVCRLDALTEEESQELLVGLLGHDRVAREPDAARSLAQLCGYFPLSLRIAAARLTTRPFLSIGDCTQWLSEDLLSRLFLTDEPEASVLHVLESALLRLPADLRRAFLHLASAPEDSSTGLLPDVSDEVLDQLGDAGFIEEGPPGPYRIHSLLRVYARQRTPASASHISPHV
ncbi:BTAD domain-containing putative transcriptional regulator [Streptomyces rubiginosohelvolus]|uniref:BTAD domain-containing putative transcriptional regulator n=1 Tax=Streptomyces rubiginosohelvolus TaxID=67362 RepID=UPI00371C5E3C